MIGPRWQKPRNYHAVKEYMPRITIYEEHQIVLFDIQWTISYLWQEKGEKVLWYKILGFIFSDSAQKRTTITNNANSIILICRTWSKSAYTHPNCHCCYIYICYIFWCHTNFPILHIHVSCNIFLKLFLKLNFVPPRLHIHD